MGTLLAGGGICHYPRFHPPHREQAGSPLGKAVPPPHGDVPRQAVTPQGWGKPVAAPLPMVCQTHPSTCCLLPRGQAGIRQLFSRQRVNILPGAEAGQKHPRLQFGKGPGSPGGSPEGLIVLQVTAAVPCPLPGMLAGLAPSPAGSGSPLSNSQRAPKAPKTGIKGEL